MLYLTDFSRVVPSVSVESVVSVNSNQTPTFTHEHDQMAKRFNTHGLFCFLSRCLPIFSASPGVVAVVVLAALVACACVSVCTPLTAHVCL